MNRKLGVISICIMGMLLMSACSPDYNEVVSEKETTESVYGDDVSQDVREEDAYLLFDGNDDPPYGDDAIDASPGHEGDIFNPADSENQFVLYLPNEDVSGFIENTISGNAVSAYGLIAMLVDNGVLPSGIQVLNFHESESGGTRTLSLDLSQGFADHIQSLGSSGEYYVVGSVVNTFLSAFNGDAIQITVDSDSWASGHAIYEGYLYYFN